jgi:hypothetical protein
VKPFAAIALVLTCLASAASAAPFVPASDDVKLEELPLRPADPVARQLQSLRAALSRDPANIALASLVARRYIVLGRESGDPRYDGYAQAALAPWWKAPVPPREVLLLRATLRQHIHEFDAALGDLGIALSRDPRDVQGLLTRATVFGVRGELDAARRDCESLAALADELIFSACMALPASTHGQLRASYARLRTALERRADATADMREWVLTLLAELAERGGMVREAGLHYKAAFAIDPADPYLIGAYADYLLDRGDDAGAADLTARYDRNDALLLRHALALKGMGSKAAAADIDALRDRYEASRLRGDLVHLREQARFTLQLAGDAKGALALARANWQVQKEAADARILLEAARAAGDATAAREVLDWLRTNGVEDVRLDRNGPAGPTG